MVEGRDTAEAEKPERSETPTEGVVSDRTETPPSPESLSQTPSKLYQLASESMEDQTSSSVFRRQRDSAAVDSNGSLNFDKDGADKLLTQPPQGKRSTDTRAANSPDTQGADAQKPPGADSRTPSPEKDPPESKAPEANPVKTVKTETVQVKPESSQIQGFNTFSKDNAAAAFSGFNLSRNESRPAGSEQVKIVDTKTVSPEGNAGWPEPKPVKTVTISGPAPGYDGPSTFQPSSSFPGGDKTPNIVELKTKTVDPEVAMSTPKENFSGFLATPSAGSKQAPSDFYNHPSGDMKKEEFKGFTISDVQTAVRGTDSPKPESGGSTFKDTMFNPTPIAYQKTELSGGIPNRESSASLGSKGSFSDVMFNPTPIAHQQAELGTKYTGGAGSASQHDMVNSAGKGDFGAFKEGSFDKGQAGSFEKGQAASFDKSQAINSLNDGSAGRGGVSEIAKTNSGGDFAKGSAADFSSGKNAINDFVKGDASSLRGDPGQSSLKSSAVDSSISTSKAGTDSAQGASTSRSANSAVTDFSPTNSSKPTESTSTRTSTGTVEMPPPNHGSTKVESFEPPKVEKPHAVESGTTHQEKQAEVPKPQVEQQTKHVEQPLQQIAVPATPQKVTEAAAIIQRQMPDVSLSLARVSTQMGGAASLENIAAAVGAKAIAAAVEAAAGTGKATSGGAVSEISGPVSLSSLTAANKSGLFIGEGTGNTVALAGRAMANAEAAAGNAALAGRQQVATGDTIPGSVANALAGGKGIFDPQSAVNKGVQFDVITGKLVQPTNLNPNVQTAINAAAGNIGNRVISNPIGTQQGNTALEGLNPAGPNGRPGGRLDPVTGRVEAMTPGSKIDAATGRIIAIPGEVKPGEFDLTELTRIKRMVSSEKRYLTGVEIALAVAIASAAVAKTRPDGSEEDSESTDQNDNNDPQPANHFKRPVHMVAASDSLVDIAERLFNNSDIAWLIADINVGRITEHMEDGKRIIELRSRQEIELPLLSEANEFLLNKKDEHKAENLVTIVGVSEIDRELLNSFLSTVVGGDSPEIAVPAPSTVLVPAGAPAPQPLMALVNFGMAMGKSIMPTMSSLLQQGMNLRTYISNIEIIQPRTELKRP